MLYSIIFSYHGNGKRDRTPFPQGLRKIKRISFNTFLSLKELFNNLRVHRLITPRGYQKKSKSLHKKPKLIAQHRICSHEPSNAVNVRDSSPWKWRRVAQWDRYINDPCEKIKGHMITGI